MSILVKSDRHLSISSVESLRNINEELREHVLRLRAQLDSEKGTLKAVHRQKVADIKNVRDQEHQKALSTVIQLKQKLKEEKDRELENQKEALSLKFESEKLKLAKQKDAEIMKIRQELEVKGNLLQKFFSQSTYQKETSSQSDNYHLRDELSELRLTKRKLEESLCEASVVEKHHAEDLKKLCDTYEVELTKVRKDVQQEVRHLIEELKAKDKVISHLEKDLGHKSQHAMQLQLENKSMQGKLSPIKMSGPIWNYSSAKETDGTNSSNSTTQMGDQELIEFKILELTTLVRDLEEQNIQLTQEKEKLLKTLKDLEQKNKPLLEKNKRFLDKNMELVTINRNLEEKVMSFSEENQTLKDQMDNSRRKANHLSRKLSQEIAERERLAELVRELTGLRRQLSEQYKTIAALKQACSEKDRRIELIQHRKMKRRLRKSLEKSTGVKETYFGYDDDARSVDSEMSASSLSHENCSDDDLWDEYAREEIERNYQQLMREYLELKKSYALIQSQSENCWDPERENKSRRELESDLFICQCQIEDLKNLLEEKGQETKMLEEKENLRSTNQILLEKIIELEKIKESLKEELHEAREQIEDLEFRILEMEEYQNKDRNNEIEELQAELSAASEEEQHPEERQEKLTLLKAHAFLDIIDKSLNDNQKINDASGRARQAVKASDERIESPTKTAAQNETKDLREPGETRMSSPKTNLRTQLMMSQQMEAKYEEVDSHRGQLQELAKGHGKGGADIAENMAQSRPAEQQIHDLEKIAYELQEKTIALQQDKAVLEEKLAATMQQLASNEIDGQCTSKVQSLESAASTSAKKLAELKENEILLRQSLDAQDSSNADAELVGQMKKKVSSLEKSNKQLRGKIAELEESEQILRTNWKQIADEDANKIECLEEKIRMIETVNQELRAKIEEQEENYATTNSISLASELLLNVSDKNDEVDLSQQVKNLEQQLQKVTEEKNCKIEILQEKLEKHRENEMKLSETIAEMEQVEQQMQAKLVLYEHSEVTVEKMLSYEDRISELTSSQENLLEEVGSMANREEDLENELVHTESKYLEIINSLKEQLQQYQQNEKQNSKAISQINPLTNENSVLKSKITDLELKQQHLNSKLEELKKENEKLKHLGKKVELLQDAESKLMERIMELEMGEPKVEYEPLVKVESGPSLQVLQKKFDFQLNDKTPYTSSSEPSKTASVPARNVSSLFGRVQELEAENQQLTSRVSELEAADLLSKKYEEKIRILEHSEGKLMDRIVELEESEQALKNNLKKQEKSSRGVFGVSEISTVRDEKKTLQLTLKHTEEEMDKIKVKFQKAQNLLKEEKEKVENLMRLEEELRRNVEEETMLNNQLTDQLRSFKERLDQVKITYDQKIDALLNSEKQLKDEINCHIQQKAALKEKLEAVQKKNCLILEKIQKFQQGKLSQTHLFSTLEDVEFQDNHHVLPRDEHASTVETKKLHSNSVVSVHPLHSFTNQEKYTVCAKCQTGSFSDLQQDYLLQISKLENSLDDLRDTSNDHSKSENFQVPLTKSNLLTHSHNDFLAMSKSDLIQMVRTLEQQQNNKQKRVKELEENLVAFRKAVEGRTTIVREEEIVKIVEKKVETFHKSKSQAFRTRPVKSSNDLDELLQQLESMKEFETELQLSLKQAQETLQQEKRKHEDDLKQLQQEIKDLEQQKGEAEQKIKELEEALANLQVQLNEKNYGLVDTTLLKSQQQEGDKLKQLKKNEVSLKNQVKELQERETELQSRLSILEKTEIVLKDKVSNLQKSSSRLKSRIKELENSGLQQQASQITQQKLQRKGNKTVEESPQQHLHISQDPKMIQVPQGDYKKWQAKVALLEEMEGQVNKTKKLNAHLEETSQLLKKGKDTCCHKVQVEIQRSQLQSYTKVFQILKDLLLTDLQKSELTGEGVPNVEEVLRVLFSKEASQRQEAEPTVTSSLTLQRAQYLGALPEEKPRTLDKGLQTDMSSNNLRPDWVERIAAEDIIVQGPSKLRPLETASPEKKRELIVNLASCLPITDIPVGSQSKSSTKDSVVEAEKILPALSGARSHQPKHKHKSKMHGSHIRQEEIEVGLWLSSEEDELQNDTDSSSSSTRVNLNGDVLDAPPLPSTQPPPLQKNTVENFVGDMSKTHKSQHHLIAKVPSEPHSSKLKVVKLEKELESKNSYITSMETAIDKLWKMLKEQGACCTEEALKELQKQLSQMQSELQDQHAEGQHSISSLRKELLNREHSLVAKRDEVEMLKKKASHCRESEANASNSVHSTRLRVKMLQTADKQLIKLQNRSSPSVQRGDTHQTIPKSKYKHSGASLYPLSSTDQLTIMSTSDEDKDIPASPQNCTGRMFSKADMNLEQHLDEKSEETGHGSFNHLPTSNSVVGEHAETKCFVAAADYNPELFSASGHLVLELPLKEGDVVKVKGPLGRSGYYEAEVNGKMGLVPAKYLHPLHNTEYGIKERRLRRLQLVPDHLDSSPEQILQLHSQLIEDHHSGYIASLPNIPSSVNRRNKPANLPHHDVSSPTSAKPQTASQNSAKGSPEAPSNFHIERLVGDSSVLLSWKTPVMDEFDRNNGSQLIGYRIFINGRLCQQPGSAHLAKAVIENIDLAHPQYFAIQSVAANGQMSRPAEVIFEGVEEEHMESEEESDTDLTAVLPKTHFEDGQQRLFIAVYDYNPYHHSPHDYTGYELAFHAGDTITVYGNQRPDGFYRGEISGQRGLVPGSFIEEVLMGTRSKMVSSHGSMTSQNSLVQMSGRSLTEKRSVRP